MANGSVHHRGWVPHTNVAMSSSARIYAKDAATGTIQQIGLIQNCNPSDRRPRPRARGLGYGDITAEIVPGLTDITVACSRIALYTKNILEVFGYFSAWNKGGSQGLVRTLAHTKNPFDLQIVIWYHNAVPEGNSNGFQAGAPMGKQGGVGKQGGNIGSYLTNQQGNKYTITWYRDCWIETWDRVFDITGNLMVVENCNLHVTWTDDGFDLANWADSDVHPPSGLTADTGTPRETPIGLPAETNGPRVEWVLIKLPLLLQEKLQQVLQEKA